MITISSDFVYDVNLRSSSTANVESNFIWSESHFSVDYSFNGSNYILFHTGMPMCMKFIDEKQLVIGYEDGTVALWDVSSCHIVSESKVHQEPGW